MLNEQRVEHIRIAIQGSTLLDDHEKADWLNLLELMNDKQLGELEEILAGPQGKSAPAPTQIPKQATQALSHISNLPKNIQAPGRQLSEPIIGDSPSLIKAPKPAPVQTAVRPSIPKVINPMVSPRPMHIPTPAPAPSGSKLPPMNPLVLSDLSSVQSLSVKSIRDHEHNSAVNALQMIAQSYGYFSTLQNFESSMLYKAYLTAGKNRLAGRPDSTLSQAEFELVTDMLQAMRLNRS